MWPGHFCEIHPIKRCSLCWTRSVEISPRNCGVKQRRCVFEHGWLIEVVDCVDLVWLIIWMICIKSLLVFLPKTASATHTSVHPVYKHDYMVWRVRSLTIHHDKLYFFNTMYAKSQRWSELGSKTFYVTVQAEFLLSSVVDSHLWESNKWFDLCVCVGDACFQRNSSLKTENDLNIYSPSCCFKPNDFLL